MKILIWLEPHFELERPGTLKGWLPWLYRLKKAIKEENSDAQFRFVAFDSMDPECQPTLAEEYISLSQAELRANGLIKGRCFPTLTDSELTAPILEHFKKTLDAKLEAFSPDFILLLNEERWLRKIFPASTFINLEVSWISRAPFPCLWQIDPCGSGKGRILRDHYETIISSINLLPDEEIFINEIRSIAQGHLSQNSDAIEFIHLLRQHWENLVLIPLSIYDSYDGKTPVFSLIDHFLAEHSQANTGYILTLHPGSHCISEAQYSYLQQKHSHCLSNSHANRVIDTQALLPLVDTVVADFSTVATQALFYDTKIISVCDVLPYFDSSTSLPPPMRSLLEKADTYERRKLLYWLLVYHTLPESRFFDGKWLINLLDRARKFQQSPCYESFQTEQTYPISEWRSTTWFTSHESLSRPDTHSSITHGNHSNISVGNAGFVLANVTERELYAQAKQKCQQGFSNEAIEDLLSLAMQDTHIWEVYSDLADFAIKQNDIPAAYDLLRVAIIKSGNSPNPSIQLAKLELAQDNPENALSILGALLRNKTETTDIFLLVREIIDLTPSLSQLAWSSLVKDIIDYEIKKSIK